MIYLLLISLVSFSNEIKNPLKFQDDFREIIINQYQINPNLKIESPGYFLNRLDLELGVSLSGDIGILGASKEKAVELIWERKEFDDKESSATSENVDISIGANSDSDDIYRQIKYHIDQVFNEIKVKKKKRKRVLSFIRKDAQKIGIVVKSLLSMPRVNDWYVSGFFKNYHFSKSGDLVYGSIGYSKRLRFRFKINSIPIAHSDRLNLMQQNLRFYMRKFQHLSQLDSADQRYQLKRVWSIHELNASLDLGVLEISKGRGIQVSFRRVPREFDSIPNIDFPDNKFSQVPYHLSLMSEVIEDVEKETQNWEKPLTLSQIRIKYAFEKSVGVMLYGVDKSNTFEFHYQR